MYAIFNGKLQRAKFDYILSTPEVHILEEVQVRYFKYIRVARVRYFVVQQ